MKNLEMHLQHESLVNVCIISKSKFKANAYDILCILYSICACKYEVRKKI